MSEPVYLYLKVNGVPVEGESLETSLGRQSSIECLDYRHGVALPRAAGSAMATGRRTYEPLVVRKRIDKSSPLLARALTQNQVVEGVFKFFRLNPTGDATTQHYFTTAIRQGRITAITQFVADGAGRGDLGNQPLEEVAFVFNQIEWTYEPGGVTYSDSGAAVNGRSSLSGADAGASASGSSNPAGAAASASAATSGAGSAGGAAPPPPTSAPEPLRPVGGRRPPSRVAATVPLTAEESRSPGTA